MIVYSELISIARQLAELYNKRAGAILTKYMLERDIVLIPAEDWHGKNAELSDEKIVNLIKQMDGCVEEIADVIGSIEALEAQRRAIEWAIRSDMVDALNKRNVQPNHRGGQDTAFDDVMDAEIMGEVEGDVNPEGVTINIPVEDYSSDIPF